MSDVRLRIVADGTEVQKEIDRDIAALTRLANAVDKTNASSVRNVRESINAQKQYAQSVGASEMQIERLGATSRRFEQQVTRMNAEANKIEKLPAKVRSGANAMATLAYSASGATGSIQGATIAAGSMAEAVALMARSARVAAAASGVGALVVVLGTVIGLMQQWKNRKREFADAFDSVSNEMAVLGHEINRDQLGAARARIQAQISQEIRAVHELRKQNKIKADEEATLVFELIEKKQRLIQLAEQEAHIEAERGTRGLNADTARQQLALTDEVAARKSEIIFRTRQEIDALKDVAMADGDRKARIDALNKAKEVGIELIDREIAKRNTTEINSVLTSHQNAKVSFEARMELLRAERDEYVRTTQDKLAADAIFNTKAAELRRQAFQSHINDLRTIEDLTAESNNARTKAIHNFVKNVRRLEMGYEAAKNTIKALHEFAAVPAALARGAFGAAALHAVAGTKFAAAAAVAASEAGGGGKGGGGGGGGGGDTGPREDTRMSAAQLGPGEKTIKFEIVLVKRDEQGRETARTRQMLQRLDDLNQPIRMAV